MTTRTPRSGLLSGVLFWSLVLSPRSSLQVLVPVLLPTDPGAAEAAKEGVTPAPASGHGEDNTLAYTGTVTAASSVHLCAVHHCPSPSVLLGSYLTLKQGTGSKGARLSTGSASKKITKKSILTYRSSERPRVSQASLGIS